MRELFHASLEKLDPGAARVLRTSYTGLYASANAEPVLVHAAHRLDGEPGWAVGMFALRGAGLPEVMFMVQALVEHMPQVRPEMVALTPRLHWESLGFAGAEAWRALHMGDRPVLRAALLNTEDAHVTRDPLHVRFKADKEIHGLRHVDITPCGIELLQHAASRLGFSVEHKVLVPPLYKLLWEEKYE